MNRRVGVVNPRVTKENKHPRQGNFFFKQKASRNNTLYNNSQSLWVMDDNTDTKGNNSALDNKF